MAFVCTIPAVPTTMRDDDDVRITRWDFAPGAVTGWHQHAYPYFVVLLTKGIMKVHNGKDVTETPVEVGTAYGRPFGAEHDVMNGGTEPLSFIEIELKRPQAVAFAPG
jgi:mannose-6-phosphate isomerase-like protein (cupin superfamily)